MITTKGIIEDVVRDKSTGVVQYRVRLPLFHEVEGASNVTTKELPLSIYPLPPHMDETILRIGDVVECTLEDGGLDNVIILGMIPHSERRNTYGSRETESKVVIKEIDTLEVNEKGSAVLPVSIKIRTDDSTKDLIEGTERNYVNGEDLSYIRGLTSPVIQQFQEIKETIDYLESNLLRLRVKAHTIEKGNEV